MTRLSAMLAQASGEKMVLTDGVFSMDGDIAPLAALAEFARGPDAWLVVDDAHGCGVLGTQGTGSFEYLHVPRGETTLLMGTLGKAFGTFGAFVAGGADVIEVLIQFARTYIYTTALPPAVAEATRESLRIVQSEPWRRDALRARVATFRSGAKRLNARLLESETPIQPIVLGSEERALRVAARLREQGVLVPAIRPPTVPAGGSRLRITFSAAHTDDDVTRLLEALAVALTDSPA
jgi:8-amino-7-oxononanoate synthase